MIVLMICHHPKGGVAALITVSCPSTMSLAEGEKCQGSGDSIPGASAVQGPNVRKAGRAGKAQTGAGTARDAKHDHDAFLSHSAIYTL